MSQFRGFYAPEFLRGLVASPRNPVQQLLARTLLEKRT